MPKQIRAGPPHTEAPFIALYAVVEASFNGSMTEPASAACQDVPTAPALESQAASHHVEASGWERRANGAEPNRCRDGTLETLAATEVLAQDGGASPSRPSASSLGTAESQLARRTTVCPTPKPKWISFFIKRGEDAMPVTSRFGVKCAARWVIATSGRLTTAFRDPEAGQTTSAIFGRCAQPVTGKKAT